MGARLNLRSVALGLALVLGACKQAETPTAASEILMRSRALAAQMCACKDKVCGAPLRLRWDELTKEISGATFTAEQVEGLATEDQRFFRCMAALEPPPP